MKHLLIALLFVPSLLFSQTVIRDTTWVSIKDTSGTVDVDLETVPSKIILQTGTNTNLALNKSVVVRYANSDPNKISTHPTASNPLLVIDGKVSSTSFFELLPGQEGSYFRIDLQAVRVVNRIVTRVFPTNSINFRVRGYSIYTSLDTLSAKKVKQIVDNDFANTNDFFDPETARYVYFQVNKQDPSLTNPFSTTFGEIEVFGTGYLQQGTFTSVVRNAGTTVNWGYASWRGNIPSGTRITMQVRTGNTPTVDSKWSSWSSEIAIPNSLFDVYEPRQYMQYRVHLYTATIETPRLDEVTISYDTDLVAKTTSAQILPQIAPILKEGQFQYQVTVESDARSQGVDTLVIFTKIPLAVSSAKVNDLNVPFIASITAGRVAIGFASTINFNATISVGLKFTPFLDETTFPSTVISKRNSPNPQRVDATITNGNESWTLFATGVPERIIVDATADPNPFTPNGDGKNDVTSISFFVANLVAERPVTVRIYDITGRVVRTLLEMKSTAQAFVEQNALRWDGRNDNGTLLPPGLYIYQIIVDVDGLSPAVVTKTVSIAY